MRLLVLAACASLLGLGASALVRSHLATAVASQADLPAEDPRPRSAAVTDAPSEVANANTAPPARASSSTRRRPVRRARSAPRNPARDLLSEDLARGIRRVGEGRYEIKRGALDLALHHLGSLSGFVRVAPAMRDGRASGFRLVAVGADGPFARLGLQQGDVLVSVNGLDITTPDHALDAYGKLRSASRFSLGLLREGHPMTREYTIR